MFKNFTWKHFLTGVGSVAGAVIALAVQYPILKTAGVVASVVTTVIGILLPSAMPTPTVPSK